MAGELYGDYSRMPVAGPHVRSLFAQQGRVFLDSDVNELTSVLLRQLRTITSDVLGPAAGPSDHLGFKITTKDGAITIGPGRYYVDGILCQIDDDTKYYDQPDAFLDAEFSEDDLPETPFLLYLRVWERTITAIEDPATREVALGHDGPDTTTRNRIVWQVRSASGIFGHDEVDLGKNSEIATAWADWADHRDDDRVKLIARANRPAGADDDPCPTPPSSRYRGLENQLYRVEIHAIETDEAGTRTVWIKWSRDNGSATYPIENLDGVIAALSTLGRDRGLMLDIGDWVEVIDDRYALYPGKVDMATSPDDRVTLPMLRVVDIDALDRTVTLSELPDGSVGQVAGRHPFIRRWDQQPRPSSSGNVVELVKTSKGVGVGIPDSGADPGEWINIEDGVQVAFQPGKAARVGDYWLIPARTETGDVEWPAAGGKPIPMAPMGIDYAFAPLAIVNNLYGEVMDLRKQFAPLAVDVP